ncbi:MAG: hypothetical protein JWN75_541 [Candidatus Saccharibacteria bacterium]|nr:hypothetical protein [Candidatus Saccharibacteria bacterium]
MIVEGTLSINTTIDQAKVLIHSLGESGQITPEDCRSLIHDIEKAFTQADAWQVVRSLALAVSEYRDLDPQAASEEFVRKTFREQFEES